MSVITFVSLAIALTPSAQQVPMRVFVDPVSGFQFNHPAAWKVKTSKLKSVFTIPIGTDKTGATVEVLDTVFHEPAAKWQEYQALAIETAKKKLDRQWQEEVLGVPILLTKASTAESTSLTGLLYSMTDQKLLFRLQARLGIYDEAERMWRESMLTLRTINGELPKPEDPERPKPTKQSARKGEKKPKPEPPKSKPIDQSPSKPAKVDVLKPDWEVRKVGGKSKSPGVETTAGGKSIIVRFVQGWSAVKSGDKIALTHPKLAGEVQLEPLAKLDSPDPEKRLMNLVNAALGDFEKVALRDDLKPRKSDAGLKLSAVRREGWITGSEWSDLRVLGDQGDYYWLMSYRAPKSAYRLSEKDLWRLIDALHLEVVP